MRLWLVPCVWGVPMRPNQYPRLIVQYASRVARRIRASRLFAWEEFVDRELRFLRIIRPEFRLLAWRKTLLFTGYFYLGRKWGNYPWLKTLVFRHSVLTPFCPPATRESSFGIRPRWLARYWLALDRRRSDRLPVAPLLLPLQCLFCQSEGPSATQKYTQSCSQLCAPGYRTRHRAWMHQAHRQA